jgi:hypothetical protein
MYDRDIKDGEDVLLTGHDDPRWVELGLNYVPTVIAYNDNGDEVSRLESIKLLGIRKGPWVNWMKEMGLK